MSSSSGRPVSCKDCGSTSVEWRQSKAGKWYLANLLSGARGSVYSDGPHYRTCSVAGPRAERLREIEAHNEAVLADRAAQQARIAQLVADRASIADLMAADASMNDLLAAGHTTEQLIAYYEGNK